MDRIIALDAAIRAAGIPIDGVSTGPPIRVDFAPSATAAQRDLAASIEAGFDLRPRRPRPILELIAAIQALPQASRDKLTAALCAQMLQTNPTLAKDLAIEVQVEDVVA